MLVNNYWFLKKYADETGFTYATFSVRDLGLVNLSGSSFSISVASQYSNAILRVCHNFTLRQGLTLIVGSGDTAEALTDYALQSPISISLSVNVVNVVSENGLQTIINATGVNTTDTEIVIKEVGIVKTNMETRDQSSAYYQSILLARKVLKNPITVPAGSNFNLIYTWDDIVD